MVPTGQPVCWYCSKRDLSVCAYGTKWSVGVLILSKETCRCVPMVPNGQPVCWYCPNRLVGVCQWYPLASLCVDVVEKDTGYITGTTWSGTISDNILDTSNEFIGFHKEVHSSDTIKRGWGLDYIYVCIIWYWLYLKTRKSIYALITVGICIFK